MADEHDVHFLLLAPGLPAAWFVQAARLYWLRFKPIVTTDLKLIASVPVEKSVAVTLLARSGRGDEARQHLSNQRRDLTIDLVEAPDLPNAEAALDARAHAGLPYGE